MDRDAEGEAAAKVIGIGALGFICLGLVGLLIYFLPVFVAVLRGHQNTAAIFILTLLLGWSFIGWAVALIWAFTAVDRDRYR